MGLVWTTIWWLVVKDSPEKDPHITAAELKYIQVTNAFTNTYRLIPAPIPFTRKKEISNDPFYTAFNYTNIVFVIPICSNNQKLKIHSLSLLAFRGRKALGPIWARYQPR